MTERQLAELTAELQAELRRLEPVGMDHNGAPTTLNERARARKLALVNALDRIRAGTYGICLDCRSPISYERLWVIPEATVCADCLEPRARMAS